MNDVQFQELAKAVRALSKRVLGKDAEIADAAGLSDETVVLQSQQITAMQERVRLLEETVSAGVAAPTVSPEIEAKVKSLDAQMMDVMKAMQVMLQHMDDQAQNIALHDRTIEVIIREPVFEKKAG
jgi:ABC-type sugar transport system ATPase subunit